MKTKDKERRTSLIVIRDARDEDVEVVSALILDSYAQFANDVPREIWQAAVEEIADVRSRLGEAELIVAEEQGRILGSVTFYPEASRSRAEQWPQGWSAFRLLCVHPSARGRRLGILLTEECIRRARARGVPTLALKTALFMVAARAVYEKLGFVRDTSLDRGWIGNTVVELGDGPIRAMAYRYDFAS